MNLRAFTEQDSAEVMGWLEKDTPGLEAVFGVKLPSKEHFVEAFSMLFEAQARFEVRLLMIEQDAQPIGFMALTDIAPQLEYGKGHMFIAPDKRRYSLAATRAGVEEARQMGLKALFLNLFEGNRAAISLGKRAGFKSTGVVTLKKEL